MKSDGLSSWIKLVQRSNSFCNLTDNERSNRNNLEWFQETADLLIRMPLEVYQIGPEKISVEDVWNLIELIAFVAENSERELRGVCKNAVLICMDLVKNQPGRFLYSDNNETLESRASLLDKIKTSMEVWNDPMSARSIERQKASMFVINGHWLRSYESLAPVVDWLSEINLLNILQMSECLEQEFVRNRTSDLDQMVTQHIRKLLQLADSACIEASQGLRARLFHSAALLMITQGKSKLSSSILLKALKELGINEETDQQLSVSDPDTSILVLASIVKMKCALGNLAEADRAVYLGLLILKQHFDKVSMHHRYQFRQNTAGYYYRTGNFRAASRIYQKVAAEDYDGKATGPEGYATVLTSRGLLYRKLGYPKRSLNYHTKALKILENHCSSPLKVAITHVHLASISMEFENFDKAESLLDRAINAFADQRDNESMIRSLLLKSRVLDAQNKSEDVHICLNKVQELIAVHSLQSHEHAISVYLDLAQHQRKCGNPEQFKQYLKQAENLFAEYKDKFSLVRGRLQFTELYRDKFTSFLGCQELTIEERWNLALSILENDRADLFSDGFSYFVHALNDPDLLNLYHSFLELQEGYVSERISSGSLDSDVINNGDSKTDRISDLLEKIFAGNKADSDLFTGRQFEIRQILDQMSSSSDCNKQVLLTYVVEEDNLHIFGAKPNGLEPKPDLFHSRIARDFFENTGKSLDETIREIRSVGSELLSLITEALGLLQAIPPSLRPADLTLMETHLKRFKRLFRRQRFQRNNMRSLINTAVTVMNIAFLAVKVFRLHPEFRRDLRSIHDKDRVIYQVLFDVLIRPIKNHIPDKCDLTVLVSELMSRIPFEALIDRDKRRSESYFIFPERSFNYVRSPWLLNHLLEADEDTDPESRGRLLTLFTPLEPESFESKDAFKFHELADSKARKRTSVLKWLTSEDATRDAFIELGPQSDCVLVESHCTFDRAQPFLSRILFARGEPLSIIDLFANHAFRLTSLMVLIACESDQMFDQELEHVGVSVAEVMLCKGVDRIIAPMWTVERRISRELVRRFVENECKGLQSMHALSKTQREQSIFSGLHPYFWAGFKFSGRYDCK